MAIPTQNVLSLCSGYGGLDLGLKMAGLATRTVCYVEREPYAAANLAALMQAGKLDAAPIWSDLTTFNGKEWTGLVDVCVVGFPCQPHSVGSAKRLGTKDDRWIWPDIVRVLQETKPSTVIIENVPGLLRSGFIDVLQGLNVLGYNAIWTRRDASEAGAPHKRSRIFLLAYTDSSVVWQQHRWEQRTSGQGPTQPELPGKTMANSHSGRQQGQRGRRVLDGKRTTLRDNPDGRCRETTDVAHASGSRLEGRVRPGGDNADQRLPWPPGPEDVEGWQDYIRKGGAQPAVRRDHHGARNRVDRLRLIGNGVCVPQAGLAIREMVDYLQEEA